MLGLLPHLRAFFMQSYETTEHRIRREFEAYGPIKKVRISKYILGIVR